MLRLRQSTGISLPPWPNIPESVQAPECERTFPKIATDDVMNMRDIHLQSTLCSRQVLWT